MTALHPHALAASTIEDDRELSEVEQARVLAAIGVMDDVSLLLEVERLTFADLVIAFRAVERVRETLLVVGREFKARAAK